MIAKKLDALYDEPGRFRRVPLSGGFDKRLITGDLFDTREVRARENLTPRAYFPFSVECKKVETWSFDRIIGGTDGEFWRWWRQCAGDAVQWMIDNPGWTKHPLLVFTRNRRDTFVMGDNTLATELDALLNPRMILYNQEEEFFVSSFDEFFHDLTVVTAVGGVV